MELIKKHWPGIALGILIGLIIIAPVFYFRYFDKAYKGLDYFGSSNEDFYLSQIQEIYDGHWSLGNIYLAEGKNDYYVQPPLPPMIAAFLGKLLGASARNINLITKFLFPALLTVLIYKFFAALTGRKDVPILMATFVMLTQATWIFLNPGAWLPFLLRGEFIGTNYEFLSYARPINPQISSFFFFGYLFCLWKFLFASQPAKSEKWYGISSAVILGLSLYTYFYAYSFLFVFSGILASWFLISRDWKNFKKMALVSAGALLVGIPYFINFFGALRSPFYLPLTQRLGILSTHKFVFSRVWFGITALFLLLYKKFDNFKLFIMAFLVAAFAVTNQQIITGKIAPMLSHYHWYYIAPVGGAVLIYLFFIYLDKLASPALSRATMIFLFLLFCSAGILFQKASYAAGKEGIISLQRYAPVIAWIDKNIKQESTIFAGQNWAGWITAYTSQNIYSGGVLHNFLVNPERFRHSLYVYTFLSGVNKENAKKFFYENRESVGASIFDQYYREQNGCYGCFPDALMEELIAGYQKFLDQNFVGELKKYPLDYLIWDKNADPAWKIDRFFHDKVYDQDGIIIYKI